MITVAVLSKLTERTRKQIYEWLKRPDWPFARVPPWPDTKKSAILKWVANTLGHGSQREKAAKASGEIGKLKDEKLQADIRRVGLVADLAQVELDKAKGKLLDATEVEANMVGMAVMVRNALQNLPSQLVPVALSQGMPNEAAAEFQQQVDALVCGVLRQLAASGGQPQPAPPATDRWAAGHGGGQDSESGKRRTRDK